MISPLSRRTGVFALAVLVIGSTGLVAIDARPVTAQDTTRDRAQLRLRVEARYEVVRLSRGIGLRPKDSAVRIGMIEITDGTIAMDGTPVSGSVVRERLGTDADLILSLSYLDPQELRALFGLAEPAPERPPAEAPPPAPSREPPPDPAPPADRAPEARRRVGEQVRVFGSVTVPRNEEVRGQAVAILGSVRVDGHVSDQVVAVMGTVDLGPEARVDGDVVAVGGRVRRAEGAEVRGNITEVAFAPDMVVLRNAPWWLASELWQPFRGAARLIGTLFRLFVLGLLVSIVVMVVRQPVEQIGHRVAAQPVKMAAIGLLAQMLLFPVICLTVVILAISIVGIPLLLLLPVALVGVLLVLLGGFTGAVHVVGGWVAARAGWDADQPYLRVWLGMLVVFAPLLVARLFGLVGGPFNLLALMVASVALVIEYVVWTTGFGAALAAAYEGRQTRGSATAIVPTPPPPSGGS